MKDFWKYLFCLVLLFLMVGCLGHSVETSGDKYLREYGDLEFENERGIQNITFIVYGSSENATSSQQEVGAKQSSETDGKLGLNGGAVSEGASSVASGLQVLDYLTKVDTPGATPPPVVNPVDPPAVKPEPPAGSTVELLVYHGRTNGTGDPDDKTDPKNRPTWYGKKDFSEYPSPMRVVIQGCFDEVIEHDGVRYYPDGMNGLLVKQSDVPGRGMSILYSNTCMSKTATVAY